MNGYNAEAAEFEIKRLRGCCEAYQERIKELESNTKDEAKIRTDEREKLLRLMGVMTVKIPVEVEVSGLFGKTWTEEKVMQTPIPVAQIRALLDRL